MQTLAIMFFLVLAELAVGGFIIALLVDYEGVATRGFLGLAGGTYWLTGLGAWWARGQIAVESGGSLTLDPGWQAVEGWGLLVFLVASLAYCVLLFGSSAPLWRAAGTVAAAGGGLSLVASGLAYQLPGLASLTVIASIVTGALVLGAATSGMILGHWYLVTPGLSASPVRLMTLVLLGSLAAQSLLIPIWMATAGEVGGSPAATALLAGAYSIPFWLRVSVGIVLPLVVAWMTLHCCRINALQSATGLLYVAMALVLAGEIVAKLLLVLAGVPV